MCLTLFDDMASPEKFHSDQGQTFVGKVMRNLYKLAGINRSNTTPYHPMGNGLSGMFQPNLIEYDWNIDQ